MTILNIFKKSKKPEISLKQEIAPQKKRVIGSKNKFIIRQVWISEKATDLTKQNQYTFIIDQKTNKSEVKKALENIYGVEIEGVNIINGKAKTKRLGKNIGVKPGNKKAVVTLKKGQSINITPR